MAKKEDDNRKRAFAFELYLDSCADDWMEQLKDTHLKILVSPLHDKCKKKDGTPKKPHYHIEVLYDGKKSVDNVLDDFAGVGIANDYIEVVASARGYARYLCHLDDPDKYQYDVNDVIALGGVDYFKLIAGVDDKYAIFKEMVVWIVKNNCHSFSDLYLYAMLHNDSWFRQLSDGCGAIKEFIKSRKFTLDTGLSIMYNEENSIKEGDCNGKH